MSKPAEAPSLEVKRVALLTNAASCTRDERAFRFLRRRSSKEVRRQSKLAEDIELLAQLTSEVSLRASSDPVCRAVRQVQDAYALSDESMSAYLRALWLVDVEFTATPLSDTSFRLALVDESELQTKLHEASFDEYVQWHLQALLARFDEGQVTTICEAVRRGSVSLGAASVLAGSPRVREECLPQIFARKLVFFGASRLMRAL